ncbi:MAG: hypothetical protein Q9195_005059 [Heterodermia aff. obscurata]
MNDSIDAENALANKEPEDLPLHHAAYEGRGVDVKRLLHAGHDIDALGRTWGTPLGAAIEGKNLAVVKLLLESGADTQISCGKYETALKAATATNNPTLVKVVADAEDRNQRPAIYGEIKWKMETIAINLENISTEFGTEMPNAFVREDGRCELEQYASASGMIGEQLRFIGSNLDPRSEMQAARLKSVIPLMSNLLRSLEILHDILSLIVNSFKIDTAELRSLGHEKMHQFSQFKESVLESVRHIKVDRRVHAGQDEMSLADFLDTEAQYGLLRSKEFVARGTKPPRKTHLESFADEIATLQSFMIRSYEALSKMLLDSRDSKEEGLKYFATYPHELEDLHKRKERELPNTIGSDGSTLDSAELATSQANLTQLNHTAMPGAWPNDDIPTVRDERPWYSSPNIDAQIERFKDKLFAFSDDQQSAVHSMRSLTTKFANEISKSQQSVLTSALNSLEASTTMSRIGFEFMCDHMPRGEWETMIEEIGDVGLMDDAGPPNSNLRRYIYPILVTSKILQESLSEASAETPNEQEFPNWTAVMEFFEWRAGYAFDKCLNDCAANIAESIPETEYV